MRKWIAILLALAMALSLAACGVKEVPQEAPAAPKQEAAPKETESVPATLPASADEDLEGYIEADVQAALDALTAEYESIIEGVDSYEAYMKQEGQIAAFYENILDTSAQLCTKMRAYSIRLAEGILSSGKDYRDMRDDLDVIYDLLYDDMGDEIYDGIYDGILDDLYDDFYDGALDDQPEDVEYKDWSNARHDEYEQWSDARSDTYEHWTDFRSDVYDFWSDLRSALWDDDLEKAWEEVEDFRKDVEKASGTALPAEGAPPAADTPAEDTPAKGIRPEFRDAMDSYEAFFDEYVTFMKEYMDSDDPLDMMVDYSDMMQQYTDTMTEFRNLDTSELSNEEMLYYTEVTVRILEKIEDIY